MYEFKLREGLRFHNGDPFTAEDVKFIRECCLPDVRDRAHRRDL
ncbi:MAG: ABC transporter substrate-binding protein [Candidatus Rokuibacteriota bacterium]